MVSINFSKSSSSLGTDSTKSSDDFLVENTLKKSWLLKKLMILMGSSLALGTPWGVQISILKLKILNPGKLDLTCWDSPCISNTCALLDEG